MGKDRQKEQKQSEKKYQMTGHLCDKCKEQQIRPEERDRQNNRVKTGCMADFFLYPKQEIADNLNKSAKN
jgi:hypothetical protein